MLGGGHVGGRSGWRAAMLEGGYVGGRPCVRAVNKRMSVAAIELRTCFTSTWPAYIKRLIANHQLVSLYLQLAFFTLIPF